MEFKMPGMNIPNIPHPDDKEAAMARADLYKLANYSFKLFKMIRDGDQLEGWVQAKVTKAADYIASVYHYMEYEMKFSEYGNKLENSDMYTESVKKEFKRKLTEAKAKLDKLKEKNIKDLDEGWEDMMKAVKDKEKEKGTGKFDKKSTSTGTVYTRKSSTFDDGGDDSDTKAAKKKAKKVKETAVPQNPDGATAPPKKDPKTGRYPKVTSGPNKGKEWSPNTPGPTNPAMKEAVKSKKDYDGDGKVESPKDEVWGSRAKAAAKSGKPFKESSKPDFLDMDKDGNKKEPMKKAVTDKKKTTETFMPVKKKEVEPTDAGGKIVKTVGDTVKKIGKAGASAVKESSKNLKQQAAIAIAKKKAK